MPATDHYAYAGELTITPPLAAAEIAACERRFERAGALCWRVEDTPADTPSAFHQYALAIAPPDGAHDGAHVLENLRVLVEMFPDRTFTGYIDKTPAPGHTDRVPSRIFVREGQLAEICATPTPTWPAGLGFDQADVYTAAAGELRRAGFPERAVNEYGSVTRPGWRVEGSSHEEVARIEHKLPEPDLCDPNRASSDELYLARLHWRDAYACVLTAAGFVLERRTVMGCHPILLARFGGPR